MIRKPILAITSAAAVLFLFSACAGQPSQQAAKEGQQQNQQVNQTSTMKSNPQLNPPAAGDKIAIVETDLGTIKFKLFTEQAPQMTTNFEELAKQGKYENVPFHRVMKNFMIQTGDFTEKNGHGGYSYKGPGIYLPDEFAQGLTHLYGTVSMASKGAGTNSNGSQFFIVTNKSGTAYLDGVQSIFGQVYEGMDVAEQIANLQTPGTDSPSKIINIKKVTITTFGQ
jgi:peptidyl-prolyl cis-trans isomerase B (cyclophilin B)